MRDKPLDKARGPGLNKARDKPLDKARAPGRNKAVAPYGDRVQVDDFTTIPGVPAFVANSLHRQWIRTFERLRAANLDGLRLPAPARAAIERWRDG